MSTLPFLLPSPLPPGDVASVIPEPVAGPDQSLYDISVGGIEFVYANTSDNPMVRETIASEKDRFDQAETPGEQTLTQWWIKSQDSFHGGAGQLQLEPAVKSDFDHVRYEMSKNVDVFTPGQVTRLPDTTVVGTDSAAELAAVTIANVDGVAYRTPAGVLKVITSVTTSPSIVAFTSALNAGIQSITTDGLFVYAATTSQVLKFDPSTPTVDPVVVANFSTSLRAVVGWVKARLMLAVDRAIYELDVSQTNVNLSTTATQFRYQHPTVGWRWRCFGASSTAILAAGDALGASTITQFTLDQVAGAPVLTVAGELCSLPVGERVLSLVAAQNTYLVLGTTKGVRVGTYNTYSGALQYGPLQLLRTDPTIPTPGLAVRDSFVYCAGLAYDEGGLLRVDLGTQIDQAGRYAWAPDLIAPVSSGVPSTAVSVLGASGRIVFAMPGTGILLEGVGAGAVRESWLRTSRVRYGTTEPKLFKLGRVRGSFLDGSIQLVASNPVLTTPLLTVGSTADDPAEFRLLPGQAEWLQVTFRLSGATTKLNNYQLKSLPATRKQRRLQFVVSVADDETARAGQRIKNTLSTRERLMALEEMDASCDEVILQEYTPGGVVATRVIIERVTFTETGRPTWRSDLGGTATIICRTVEQ